MELEELNELVEDIPFGEHAEVIIYDVIADQEMAIEYIKVDGTNSKGVPIIKIGVA